jgi:hypothetical protein
VDLVWYPTDLPFQDTPSVVNSLDWDEAPWEPRVVGEEFGAARMYNGREQLDGLKGDHQCGAPEEFEQGQAWPYIGPRVEYDADGIPLCCGRDPVGTLTVGVGPAGALVAPADGCTCAGAIAIPTGSQQTMVTCAPGGEAWRYCDLPAGTPVSFNCAMIPNTTIGRLFRGTVCGQLTLLAQGSFGAFAYAIPAGPAARYWVQISGQPAGMTAGYPSFII